MRQRGNVAPCCRASFPQRVEVERVEDVADGGGIGGSREYLSIRHVSGVGVGVEVKVVARLEQGLIAG